MQKTYSCIYSAKSQLLYQYCFKFAQMHWHIFYIWTLVHSIGINTFSLFDSRMLVWFMRTILMHTPSHTVSSNWTRAIVSQPKSSAFSPLEECLPFCAELHSLSQLLLTLNDIYQLILLLFYSNCTAFLAHTRSNKPTLHSSACANYAVQGGGRGSRKLFKMPAVRHLAFAGVVLPTTILTSFAIFFPIVLHVVVFCAFYFRWSCASYWIFATLVNESDSSLK